MNQDPYAAFSDPVSAPAAQSRQAQRQPAPSQPRGLRNNNPGNIEDGAFARSLPGYAGSDGRFARFETADAGSQAAPRLLQSYLSRGFDTPAEIINRWAPPSDNNPTEAYAAYVARRVGVGVNDPVSPEQVELIAQAISEFENGQTVADDGSDPYAAIAAPAPAPAPAPQAETPAPTGDLRIPYGQTAGANIDRRFDPSVPFGSQRIIAPTENASEGRNGRTDEELRAAGYKLSSGEWRLDRTPEQMEAMGYDWDAAAGVWKLRHSEEYVRARNDARDFMNDRDDGVQERVRAVNSGMGFNLGDELEELIVEAQMRGENTNRRILGEEIPYSSETYGSAYDDESDARQQRFAEDRPLQNLALQTGAGLLTPGLRQAGDFIGSAGGVRQSARSAVVGGGYGAAYGAGAEEGGLEDRVRGGLLGGAVGAATGGLLDSGMQRSTVNATRRAANPSPARTLSREGVQLTPGQMLESTPLIGGLLRKTEDAATSIPIAGPSIQAARTRGVETFNVAAYNRALAPIGQSLPRNTRPGYEAVQEVQRRLGQAYDDVLPNISARLDQPLYDDIARALDTAATEMPKDRLAQLVAVLENRVFRNVDQSNATLTGEQFKRIESELGALVRQFQNANDPSVVSFSDAVGNIQGALREMVARQNPEQAARIRQINEGYANLVRIERAAGSGPAQATDGVFSPTQLGVAVNTGTSRGTRARGGGLLQDLASAGRQILPSSVNNSGTVDRAGLLALATGGAAVVNPVVTIPVIALTAGAYTKPAQAALNAIYRSTDRQSATSALAELQRFAARNPALQSYYQDAVQHVQRVFQSSEQAPAPARAGLLSPTAP